MQSKILESIGVDPAYILIAMFLILIVLCTFFVNLNMKYNRLKRSYSKFMRGSDGKTLEENIRRHLEKMESIEELSEENQLELRLLREKSAEVSRRQEWYSMTPFTRWEGNSALPLLFWTEKIMAGL